MTTAAISAVTTNGSSASGAQPFSSSPPQAVRNRLPDERMSMTHKFEIGGHEGYITVGLYPDGKPGEVFITMAKEGSTVSGLISSFAQAISIGLQHGVPLKLFCEKFSHTRFDPSGWSGNPEIRQASSVLDYIFRWMELRFRSSEKKFELASPIQPMDAPHAASPQVEPRIAESVPTFSDAPSCKHCGSITTRNGSCYICTNCGSSSGCS
jgi:ribonucleoside-diphosphate reductase alpha chain